MKRLFLILALMFAAAASHAQMRTIKVLFVVSPSLNASRGTTDLSNSIDAALVLMNQSFTRSGVTNVQVVKASYGVMDLEYPSAATAYDAVSRDYLLNRLRDVNRADLIFGILNIGSSTECGAAPIYASADTAYAFAGISCFETRLTFQHEIGHLIGFRHDVSRDSLTSPFYAGHGYFNASQFNPTFGPRYEVCFHTIMSYTITPPVPNATFACTDQQINNWSNPIVNVGSYPAGYPSPPGYGLVATGNYLADEASILNGVRMNEVTNWWQTPTSPSLLLPLLASILDALMN